MNGQVSRRMLRRFGGLRRMIVVGALCATFVLTGKLWLSSGSLNVGSSIAARPDDGGRRLKVSDDGDDGGTKQKQQHLNRNKSNERDNAGGERGKNEDKPAPTNPQGLQPKIIQDQQDPEPGDQRQQVPAADSAGDCTVAVGVPCTATQLAIAAETSLDDNKFPFVCINNLRILDSAKLSKGFNVIVLHETSHAVEDIKYFDVLGGDKEFVGFVSSIEGERVLIVVSFGDVAEKISGDSRELLQKFGSGKIADYKRGMSLVFIGQKGLAAGGAFESFGQITDKEASARARIAACVTIPLGKLDSSVQLRSHRDDKGAMDGQMLGGGESAVVGRREAITYGAELPHCGRRDPCPKNSTAFSFYSGKNKDDNPKMCINGRFVIDRNLNKAGRGLNIVIIDTSNKQVLRVGNFDTYAQDSSTLEIFLEQVVRGEMVAVISFDEAATRLSNMAKQMFYELGSGLVQNIKFRASWYFVGQKGISGFTPFEELNYPQGSDWAKPIDLKICIPDILDGMKARPDPIVRKQNDVKRHFCTKFDGYEEFCDESRLDELLTPAPVVDKARSTDPIFKVPILIVAGLSHNALRLCLETVMRQEGVDPSFVVVAYDELYEEAGMLAKIFSFTPLPINASTSYKDQFTKAVDMIWSMYPKSDVAIVIEEELLLTNDFLYFMSQLLPVYTNDKTLATVSAWNNNGYPSTSSLPHAVYRVEGAAPGLAFMMKKSVWESRNADKCCGERSWEGWDLLPPANTALVPDVSRVLRRHTDGVGAVDHDVEALFHRERVFVKNPHTQVQGLDLLSSENYDVHVVAIIKTAVRLKSEKFEKCEPNAGANVIRSLDSSNQSILVVFPGAASSDNVVVEHLTKCFGLYYSKKRTVGFYKGVLRFSVQRRPVLLISETSLKDK